MINDLYFSQSKSLPNKSSVEKYYEYCFKTEPKPIYCELPDELKFDSSGTVQTYTYTSSFSGNATLSGTSTTTTI